jgi:hypothetical protein
MAQMQFTIQDFSQTSTWKGYVNYYEGGEVERWYTTPSTVTTSPKKSYDISSIPAGAIIDSAVLSQARNSPFTGISKRQVDGADWTGTKDVTTQLQAMGGVYTVVEFAFTFKAWGGQGGQSTGGTTISSTLQLTANTLTVTYRMPTSAGTLNKTTVNAGESIKVTITPAESGRTHRVLWTFGAYSDDSGTLAAETLEDSLTVPLAWLNAIPNATSGVAKCRLSTYDGATLLGYRDYPFTIACPVSIVPALTFPAPTHIPYSEGVADWGYVQGYSKASMAITEAEGAYGSTITAYNIIGGGYDSGTDDELTTGFINAVGTVTFTARVTDSRGRTKTETQSVNVTAYEKPSLVSNIEERCLSTGVLDTSGTYASVYINYAITAIGDNAATATVKWREVGGAWGAAEAISDATALTVGAGGFNVGKEYDVLYTVTDSLATRTFAGYISKAQFLMEFSHSGRAVGILGPYGADEVAQLPATADIKKGTETYVTDADYTADDVLAKLLTVDGSGSGLDADKVRGMTDPARGGNITSGDMDAIIQTGVYYVWTAVTNKPTSGGGLLIVAYAESKYIMQVFVPNSSSDVFRVYIRNKSGSTSWRDWMQTPILTEV